jgi:hypothetical protein
MAIHFIIERSIGNLVAQGISGCGRRPQRECGDGKSRVALAVHMLSTLTSFRDDVLPFDIKRTSICNSDIAIDFGSFETRAGYTKRSCPTGIILWQPNCRMLICVLLTVRMGSRVLPGRGNIGAHVGDCITYDEGTKGTTIAGVKY